MIIQRQWKDALPTLNKLLAIRTMLKMFLHIVAGPLSFQFVCSRLKGTRLVGSVRTCLGLAAGKGCCCSTHGAALVSKRMCFSLSSLASGRCWRCFSRESRRSTGEMRLSSTDRSSADIAAIVSAVQMYSSRNFVEMQAVGRTEQGLQARSRAAECCCPVGGVTWWGRVRRNGINLAP